MKNLDVEKLERRNVFKTPEDFFDQMQSNVLQEIQISEPVVFEKQGRVIKMNRIYAVAAIITLFFGITFFVIRNNDSVYVADNKTTNTNNDVTTDIDPQNEEMGVLKTLEKDLTSIASENRRTNIRPTTFVINSVEKISAKKNRVNSQNTEIQVDQILADFTTAELTSLGKNAEQDVYLDLYD
jgi:hypothetical protein